MRATLGIAAAAATLAFTAQAAAQTAPTVVDPKLEVREVETRAHTADRDRVPR